MPPAGWANPLANGLDAAVVNAGFINKLFPLMLKFWLCDCMVGYVCAVLAVCMLLPAPSEDGCGGDCNWVSGDAFGKVLEDAGG